jgi:hypothetical protein
MSMSSAPSLPLEVVAARRTESAEMLQTATELSRREATLRSAATTCLAGIALVQAIELPSLFGQGRQFAVLAMGGMTLCLGLCLALAATAEGAARHLWSVVAGTSALVLAAWVAPRALTIPGLAHHQGHWTSMPGGAAAVLAAVCLVIAVVAAPPTRASARALATGVAVVCAFTPAVGTLLVALGPGLSGGEGSLASGLATGAHVHAHGGLDEALIQFQPIAGGHGGHYVYRAPATPHQTMFGVALIIVAALIFTYGALGYLRRRTAPAVSVALSGIENGGPA